VTAAARRPGASAISSLGRGAEATERGMRAALIVEVDKGWQGRQASCVGDIGPGIGPLAEECLNEPLGLAVGLGPIGPSPGLTTVAESGPIGGRAIRPTVVGHDPLDRDPVGLERRDGELERGRGAGAALVGDVDDDAPPAAIVDDDLEVVVAEAASRPRRGGRPAKRAVAAAVGDPPELLVVLVDEGAGVAGLVAPDWQPGGPIEVDQPRRTGAAEDRGDRRGRVTEERAEAIGTPAPLGSGGQDPVDLGARRGPRRTVRPRAAIGETGAAFGPEAADPLVAGGPADALRLGRRRHRPAEDRHPGHQQFSTKDVETGSRMGHESLLTVRCFNTPNRDRRLSFVNNVFGGNS